MYVSNSASAIELDTVSSCEHTAKDKIFISCNYNIILRPK